MIEANRRKTLAAQDFPAPLRLTARKHKTYLGFRPIAPGRAKACNNRGWERSMTKAELIAAIAEEAGLNRTQAKDALEAFINSVTNSLKSGNEGPSAAATH